MTCTIEQKHQQSIANIAMPELKNANVISTMIMIEKGMRNMSNIPQTDNTRTIPVNVYDAKVFITKIQSQIEILEMVNKHDEAKHWKSILQSAEELLNVNSK